jgi:hypothetical protein
MIQMDVGQQYVCHVLETDSDSVQAELQRVETGRGAGINERDAAGAADDRGGDDVWIAAELEINPGNAGREDRHARARHYTEHAKPA